MCEIEWSKYMKKNIKLICFGLVMFILIFPNLVNAYAELNSCKDACNSSWGECLNRAILAENVTYEKCMTLGLYATYEGPAEGTGTCYEGSGDTGEYSCSLKNGGVLPLTTANITVSKTSGNCYVSGTQVDLEKGKSCTVQIKYGEYTIKGLSCKTGVIDTSVATAKVSGDNSINLTGVNGGSTSLSCSVVGQKSYLNFNLKSVTATNSDNTQAGCNNCNGKCMIYYSQYGGKLSGTCPEGFYCPTLKESVVVYNTITKKRTETIAAGTTIQSKDSSGITFFCEEDNAGASTAENIDTTLPGWNITPAATCEELLGTSARQVIKLGIIAIRILTPLLLIILSGREFLRAIASQDQDALVKAWKTLGKRSIIGVAIMLLPTIVNLIGSLFGIFDSCGIW